MFVIANIFVIANMFVVANIFVIANIKELSVFYTEFTGSFVYTSTKDTAVL
jgi:hypothetical protein